MAPVMVFIAHHNINPNRLFGDQVIPLQTSKPRRLIIQVDIMTAELIPSRIIAQRSPPSANARTASVGSSLPCALSAGYSS